MRRRRARARTSKQDPSLGSTLALEIERIGRSGDGIAVDDGRPVYVPITLPGDRLTARLTAKRGQGYAAELLESQRPMPRRLPVCRHFGACGGCRLQHLPAPLYRDWKRDQVATALKNRGIEGVDVRPLIEGEPGTRRRLRLAFRCQGDRVVLGHRKRERQDVVPIVECPIALPEVVALFEPLRRLLDGLDMAKAGSRKSGGEVSITAAETGLDVLIDTDSPPTLADRERLAALAEQEDLARIAWRPDPLSEAEPIAARRQVIVRFGDVPAVLPPGAFLQATAAAERAIVTAVAAAIEDADPIADLFAGCGAIGLPLARQGRRILALERDPAMVRTLNAAARSAGLATAIAAEGRDLSSDPLSQGERHGFEALILDPPRAGAGSQIQAIARSPGPEIIAMVSCNPATFARDARTLIDAGYRLAWVQPIDAFLYSAEVELVAAFKRARPLDS